MCCYEGILKKEHYNNTSFYTLFYWIVISLYSRLHKILHKYFFLY